MAQRRSETDGQSSQRGLALVSVIWGAVLIAAIAASFVYSSRTDVQIARNMVEAGRARALAEAGIYLGIEELLTHFRDRHRVWDGQPHRVKLPGGHVTIEIRDESGKVDLNYAPKELLEKLFEAAGVETAEASSLAQAILDWRDADDIRRPDGAERQEYRSAGLDRGPRNGPFRSVNELRGVLGVTPAVFEAVSGGVTVYSRRRGADPASADDLVLHALLGDEAGIAAIRGSGSDPGRRSVMLAVRGQGVSRRLLSSSSRIAFAIHATSETDSGGSSSLDAVVGTNSVGQRPYTVLEFHRE